MQKAAQHRLQRTAAAPLVNQARFARNGAIIGVSVNLQPDTEIDLGDQAAEVHKLLSR